MKFCCCSYLLQCAYSLLKSTKKVFSVQVMAFSKYVTRYCPRSGFLYYNLITLHQDGSPYPPHGEVLSRSVNLRLGNFHRYPENQLGILYFSFEYIVFETQYMYLYIIILIWYFINLFLGLISSVLEKIQKQILYILMIERKF